MASCCPTCDGPVPENDDRFLPYCSDDCQRTLGRQDRECFARDCQAGAKPMMLMCWGHWKRVPRIIQAAVWDSNDRAHPDYTNSRRAARAAISAKECLPLTSEDQLLLQRFNLGLDGYPKEKTT